MDNGDPIDAKLTSDVENIIQNSSVLTEKIEGIVNARKDQLLSDFKNKIDQLPEKVNTEIENQISLIPGTIVEGIQSKITEAIKAGDLLKINLLGIPASPKSDSKIFQSFIVLIPVIATALIGWYVWDAQKDIEKRITEGNETFKSQLALSSEKYKKKSETYDEIRKQMEQLFYAFRNLQANSKDPLAIAKASESLIAFDSTVKLKTFYIGDNTKEECKKLWNLSRTILQTLKFGEASNVNQIPTQIKNIETAMQKDVDEELKSLGVNINNNSNTNTNINSNKINNANNG